VTAPSLGFAAVVGHAETIVRLRAVTARDRLAAAYLLYGDDAIGKRTLAEAWIRLLQCRAPVGDPDASEACGACVSCHHHDAGTHPDVVRLEPQDATVIKIDQIRALQEHLPYHPLVASRRAVLVPDVSLVRTEAANALLKTLEEPPPHVVFILIASQRERLLPTIVSRCQSIRCAPPSPDAVLDHLTRRLGVDPARARDLLIQAHGRIGPAIDAAHAPEGDASTTFDDIGSPSTITKPARLLALAEGVGKDQHALKTILAWVTLWLRDVLAWHTTRDPRRVLHPDRQSDLTWWTDRLSIDDVIDLASGIHAVWVALHRNLNPQLAAEVVLLHLSNRVNTPLIGREESA
jgi:DNA polymerase-3 subunit delta'